MNETEAWIAARGLWPVSDDPAGTPIPDDVLDDADLSLMAKGLYACSSRSADSR